MSDKNDIQITPIIANIIWYYIKIILVVDTIFLLIENIGNGKQLLVQLFLEWPIIFCIFLLFVILTAGNEQKRNILEISSIGITGPSANRRNERVFILFNEINIERSKNQNIFQKLLRNRNIYSKNKEFIIITPEFYSKEQIENLYNKLHI